MGALATSFTEALIDTRRPAAHNVNAEDVVAPVRPFSGVGRKSMNTPLRRAATITMVGLALVTTPAAGRAEVTNVVLTHCTTVLGGKSFGDTGPYEKCFGKIYFALDPNSPRNRIIADLDKAVRNARGMVEFSSDLFVLRPTDPSRGNGVLFFDVVNRGGKRLLGVFNLARGATDPTTEEEFGDGFLMREGYTLIAVGWETSPNNPSIALYPPIATDSGRPITGEISNWFIPVEPSREFDLTASYWTGFEEYPPLDPRDPDYTLTERLGYHGEPHVIPRETWEFGRLVNDDVIYDPHYLLLWTGFKPGYMYELTYETKDPIVAGVGFAAIRDAASHFKFDPEAVIRGRYAYATGASQTGRYLRQMIHEGFTVDESGDRAALDAVFVQTGGASLGSFNQRFGQPNDGGFHSATRFPILYQTTRDPASGAVDTPEAGETDGRGQTPTTGRVDGLGARIPDGLHPKVFFFETASEYWDRGRVAALNHTSLDGKEDVPLADNVRFFMMASIPHGSGSFPPSYPFAQQEPSNPLDYRPVQRALLVGLDRWVREGKEAPPSQHPKLADGSLIPQKQIKFPEVPGVQWPRDVPGGYRTDLPGRLSDNSLPFLVPNVDGDGNEVSGVVLPDVSVPLATYTGWAFRSARAGAPTEILAMAGSYVPLPRTTAERSRWGDPRLSIEERYAGRADYLRRYEEAARRLVAQGYLLEEDVQRLVKGAGEHWDWLMNASESRLRPQ